MAFPFNGHTTLLEAALIYVGEGFSVIPLHFISGGKCSCGNDKCSSPAKHPLTQRGLKDASKDPVVIKDWWTKYKRANIGIVTGDVSGGLIIVDIDTAKGGSVIGLPLPITLEVETGNGFHFWLKSSQAIRNSAGKLGQGIDVRGNGGYVVAPPSIHYSGRNYSFRNQDPIAEFPEELLLKLAEPKPKENSEDDDLILSSHAPKQIADFAQDGSRHKFLVSVAGKLRRSGFSSEEILATLRKTNQERCKPPVDDRRLEKIARTITRYTPAEELDSGIEEEDLSFDQEQGEIEPNLDTDQEDTGQSVADAIPEPAGKDPLLGAMTADDFDQAEFPEGEMILQGLRTGEWGLIVGIGSVGKTTLLLNVCVSLASGRPFVPIIPANSPPRRILYIGFEDSDFKLQGHVRKIREALTEEENKLAGKNLYLVVEPEVDKKNSQTGKKEKHPWRMTDAQSLLNLRAYIKKNKIDLVIIDTLSQGAQLKDENNNGEVQQKVVLPIRRLVKYCNVAILLVHHEGRGKPQQNIVEAQYAGRGASSLMDAARYQINLALVDKNVRGVVKVSNPKDKGEGFEDKSTTLTLDKTSRWFSPAIVNIPIPATKKLRTRTLEDKIIEVLETDGGEMTPKEIAEKLPGVSRVNIRAKLRDLEDDELVTRSGHGRYRLFVDEGAP